MNRQRLLIAHATLAFFCVASMPSHAADTAVAPNEQSVRGASDSRTLRILPLGDSITRGSYLRQYRDGPHKGKAVGLPHSDGGGYRKPLQDRLSAAGINFDFVGDLNYGAFGRDGVLDMAFDPDHHGLAGFGNVAIQRGGVVPTPRDVLEVLSVKEIRVSGIAEVLRRYQPDIILLMSGANGFNSEARDRLIRTIGEHSRAHLLVAAILPQKAPRAGWKDVVSYNRSLPAIVEAQHKAGKRISLVDMYDAITPDELMADGVHPGKAAMKKMADVWFNAIVEALHRSRSDPS